MNEVAYRLVRKATARGRPCSVGPEGGIDLRVRASVNTIRFNLSREPSLAMIPAWRPSLVARAIGLTKDGLHVILPTITFTTQAISLDFGFIFTTP